MNKSILIGRITKELELKKTPSGASVVTFTLAVNRKYKQDGQPDADFINCVAWNKTAEIMCQYLNKGSQIGIDGRIQTRSYDDKDGKKVYITEIVVESFDFLESKQTQQTTQQYTQNQSFNNEFANDTLDIDSDDLPF